MMAILDRKALVKLTALGLLAGCSVLGLMMVTRVSTSVSTGEETEQIFNDAAVLPDEMIDAVTWLPDSYGLARDMEPLTRLDITDGWLRAWAQLAVVAETGDPSSLETYFSSSALAGLEAAAPDLAGMPVHQIGHDLRLDFYSEDGQVVALEATDTRLLRAIPTSDGGRAWYDTTETYEALLLLEDGNWRVQHWVRGTIEGDRSTAPPPRAAVPPSSGRRGINYYPRDTPWASFWTDYDPVVVDEDLDRIQALGLDSVRIFIPFQEMNGRHVTADDLASVVDFLDRARSRTIGVIVTLFDGRTDHRPVRWDADEDHVAGVAEALAGHPSIVMWDLKNEPDRDIGIHGVTADLLYAWLGHLTRHLRSLDPLTPVTIGWSTGTAALEAPVQTDVVSFHHYGPADELPALVEQLRTVAGDRPVWLTEFGLPTWNTLLPNGHTEAEQAAYYVDIINGADGLDGLYAWTLWDLAVPPPDAGVLPWKTGPQTNLGLLRADGTPKPAAGLLAPEADLTGIPRPNLVSTTAAKPFRLVVLGLLASSLAGRRLVLRVKRVRADRFL